MSSLIFLSDCTPVYSVLGSPGKITNITIERLNGAVRLLWFPPSNSSEIPIDTYIIRYGKTNDPDYLINGYLSTALSTATITGLLNGVSYRFWISASNRFGEGVLSDPQSIDPGAAPEAITMVRRSYHSTIATEPENNMQKIGIEFVPPLNYNGAVPSIYTIQYSLHNVVNPEIFSIEFPVNQNSLLNELMVDRDASSIYNTNGFMGNYVLREITIPNTVTPGNYAFTVYSKNIYGTSIVSIQSIIIPLGGVTPRFISPTLSLPSDNIIETLPGNNKITIKWLQTSLSAASAVSGVGWKYRIQYTNNKNYWFYPEYSQQQLPVLYREYDISYDNTKLPGTGVYTFDISRNVYNGIRYYIRYSIINPSGDTSQYTLSNSSNENITSTIPGTFPDPPDIFRSSVEDRTVELYFSWDTIIGSDVKTDTPSITKTGGYPVLDYRIERYKLLDIKNVNNVVFDVTFSNVKGPFFRDINSIVFNGIPYLYRIYTRTQIGFSLTYNSVVAISLRKSDIPYNVSSLSVDLNQITLQWNPPVNSDITMPIVQYYIEYKIFDLSFSNQIPSNNIIGSFTNALTQSQTIIKNVNDMNSILVNDDLWDKVKTTARSIKTGNTQLSYTITDLVNYEAYIFRVAAITQDISRRQTIGLTQVIGDNSPYVLNPKIIGKVPSAILKTDTSFVNGDRQLTITWSSVDRENSEQIVNFIFEYSTIDNDNFISTNIVTVKKNFYSSIFRKDNNRIYFMVTLTGLDNNVNIHTNSHSYNVIIYAENSIGFTNTTNKLHLNTLYDFLKDTYQNVSNMNRYVRPGYIPIVPSL